IRSWSCAATITGEGMLLASAGVYDEARGVKATGVPNGGTITYTGDLSGFAGYLNAGGFGQTYYSGWTLSQVAAKLTTVIAASSAFPQATPGNNLLERSIIVKEGAKLSFTCDVTSPATRGWDFGDGTVVPTVNVDSGYTVTILGPVKGSAGLNKTGAGTLILNVGGEGEYDTITLTGAGTVTAERLAEYVAACDDYISSSIDTVVDLALAVNGGSSVKLSSAISYFPENASAILKVLYGTAADALNETVTAASPVAADGIVPLTVKDLSRGTTYYFKAVLELPGDKTAESAVLPVTMITDYTPAMRRVEYIESTGTQYIDSWYYPSPDTHVKADFQFTTVTKQHRMFGLNVGGQPYFNAYINDKGNFGYCRSDATTWSAVGNPETAVGTIRYLHDFNYIDGSGQHAYTIYGPDGSVTATQSPMAGTITKTATVPLAIAATRNAATGGVTDGQTAEGHRIYSFVFDEGDALTAALAPAVRASDSAVGLYDCIHNMFLPSESADSYVAGPSITTVERFTGTTLTAVDLTFLGAPYARTLKVAYGSGFGGDNPADWDVTEAVATVAAGATSCSVSVPANWGTTDAIVLRCYFDDGTSFPLWSDTIVYRVPTDPIITGVMVDGTGGDTLVVSGNLSYFPGDDCTLSVRVTKDGGSPVVWSELAGAVRTATGAFELTLQESDTAAARYIEPGATYMVVVEAVSGEATGSSAAIDVTTKGGPVFRSSSSSVNRRTVTFTGNLSDLGANGSATVTLYVGTANNDGSLVAVETPVVRTATGAFTIAHTFDALEKTYYWQLRAVATTTGGRTLETRTAVASCKTLDTTTYTWQAVDGDWSGRWDDTAHWKPNIADCLGYPQSSAATVSFLNCTTENPVVVTVNGKYTVKQINLFDADAADLSFVGTGKTASSLKSSNAKPSFNGNDRYMRSNSRLSFKDIMLDASGQELDFAVPDGNTATGMEITFSGATVKAKAIWLRANGSSLSFCDNTDVTLTEKLSVGGVNTVITIDNSTVTTPSVYAGDNRDSTGLKFRLAGAAPILSVTTNFQTYNRADTITLEFAVPVGGYSTAPINKTGAAFATKVVNEKNVEQTPGTFRFAVAEDSPALKRSSEQLSKVLVQTQNGFAMDYIAEGIGTVPEHKGESCGAFKWGLNGAALEGEEPDLTTARQLLLDLKGYGKGVLFLVF
ncbi:MAG: hypothetical protein IJ829_05620, partial [Kiritimatiellae bacterium]|nr:hypothetical protein [Kiritimatiellia bacterium]